MNLREPPFKRRRQVPGTKLDDLPELPFEKILSYLSLKDRIRSRAVSRRWYKTIDHFKVNSLYFSRHPVGFIHEKKRLVGTGAFAQNFISSTRFSSFFRVFTKSILFSLKHLRVCDLQLKTENRSTFVSTLNSFGQLEELGLFRVNLRSVREAVIEVEDLELTLPMLECLRLEQVEGIEKLTLEAPRLQKIQLWKCFPLKLDLVHGESVTRLETCSFDYFKVKNTDNRNPETRSAFLSSLKGLKEIHLDNISSVLELFEQKQLDGRSDLRVYLYGCLLSGPDDPAIDSFSNFWSEDALAYLAENPSRLTDEIPFLDSLKYSMVECVAPGSEINILKRFTHLKQMSVHERVQKVERFLQLLKNIDNIVELTFYHDQPQSLFDQLPEHCSALQKLDINRNPSALSFLFQFKHLISVCLGSTDLQSIRKVLEEFEFLSWFRFLHKTRYFKIEIMLPKRFKIVGRKCVRDLFFDSVDSLLQGIVEKETELRASLLKKPRERQKQCARLRSDF